MVPGVLAVAAQAQIIFGEGICPLGLLEGHGLAAVGGHEHDGVAHGVVIGLFGRVGLVKFILAFAADAEFRAGIAAEGAVAGGVHEDLGGEAEGFFRGGLTADGGGDQAPDDRAW